MSATFQTVLKDGRNVSITIRNALREDLDDLWANFNQVVQERCYIPVITQITSEYERTSWFYNHEEEKNIIIVADFEGKVVGQCVIEHSTWEACYVGELGILIKKEFRHAKPSIGRKLMTSSIEEARKKNFEKICLAVFSTNKNAIKLYEDMGFIKVGMRKKQYRINGQYYDEVLMDYFFD
ncbi:MAG: GNAT family N-acetyltransferase [Candidatus Helarchaeota archaeon]